MFLEALCSCAYLAPQPPFRSPRVRGHPPPAPSPRFGAFGIYGVVVLATPSMHDAANIDDDVQPWMIVVAVIILLLEFSLAGLLYFLGMACQRERRRIIFGHHTGHGMPVPMHAAPMACVSSTPTAVAVPMQGVPVQAVPVQPQATRPESSRPVRACSRLFPPDCAWWSRRLTPRALAGGCGAADAGARRDRRRRREARQVRGVHQTSAPSRCPSRSPMPMPSTTPLAHASPRARFASRGPG